MNANPLAQDTKGVESVCSNCGRPIMRQQALVGPDGWWHWETDSEDCAETMSFYQRLMARQEGGAS